MSSGRAFVILLLVVVLVAAFLAFCSWIGVSQFWAGFLFLFQWSLMEEAKNDRLIKSLVGAVVGTSIAFIPIWLTPEIGLTMAMLAMVAVILIAVFFQIRHMATVAINGATMLFLTVNTIPFVAQNAAPADVFAGLFSGAAFFGGLALLAAWVMAKRQSAAPSAVPSAL